MTPHPYADLIERLEKAEGPDRESDAAIYQAVFGEEPVMVMAASYGPNEKIQPVGVAGGQYVRRFTASIDAALTLVPKGYGFSIYAATADFSAASIYDPPAIDERGHRITNGRGAGGNRTPAIALCIASLRARSALTPSGGEGG